MRFSTTQPFSTKEWSGISPSDIDMLHARSILEDRIDLTSSTLVRLAAIFSILMNEPHHSSGIPTDEIQNASPIKTYEMMSTGQARGWCGNYAVMFYLFANAADITTRLVDIAGKFGRLKLTGHYVCECWIPEHATWCFVDPQGWPM